MPNSALQTISPPTLAQVIQHYWPVLAVSFGLSLLATPICRSLALRRGIVDRPDDFLKPHKKPIPYLGGLGIFAGWAGGLILAIILFGRVNPGPVATPAPVVDLYLMIGILIAGAVIVGLGLFDDLRLMSPRAKLLGTALVTFWLMFFGLGDDTILILARATHLSPSELPYWLVLLYSIPLSQFTTMGACNATNLIDGLDGLCSGVLGIIAAGFLVLAVHLHIGNNWNPWDPWDVQRVVLCLAMMGAALGFLPYNRNPATIFMGDAGSMLLGLNAAILLLLFAKSNAVRWLLGSLMVFGLPLADMSLAMLRRWRNGKPLTKGDRSHFYDQLVDRGLSVKKVVGISYTLAAFFVVMGCATMPLRTRYVIPLYFLVVIAAIAAIARFDMVRIERPPPSGKYG